MKNKIADAGENEMILMRFSATRCGFYCGKYAFRL